MIIYRVSNNAHYYDGKDYYDILSADPFNKNRFYLYREVWKSDKRDKPIKVKTSFIKAVTAEWFNSKCGYYYNCLLLNDVQTSNTTKTPYLRYIENTY